MACPPARSRKVERDGAQLVLVAKIKKRYGPVYKNARAAVRPITPLNDIYLDIVDPGTAAAGKADRDTPLPQSQTTTSVTVPDVLDGLRADQRLGAAARSSISSATAWRTAGSQLQRAFVAAAPFVRRAGDLTRQIAVRERATKQLVTNTAILTRELGRRDRELRRLVTAGTATVTTLQAGSRDLDQTLAELGPTVLRAAHYAGVAAQHRSTTSTRASRACTRSPTGCPPACARCASSTPTCALRSASSIPQCAS